MKTAILARPDHSVSLYEGLAESGVDVDLYTYNAIRRGSMFEKLFPTQRHIDPEIHVSLLCTAVYRFASKLKGKINHHDLIRRATEVYFSSLDLSKVDVVHYWPMYASRAVRRARQEWDMRTVAEVYEANPAWVNRLFQAEYEKNSLGYVPVNTLIDQNEFFNHEKNVIVPSAFVRDTYREYYPDARYFVTEYAVSETGHGIVKKSDVSDDGILRIGFVGRVCLEKGVQYLVRAVRKLGSRAQLTVIGSIATGQEHLFVDEANVQFVGYKSKARLFEALASFDVICLPSLSDAYPLSIVEALKARVPVVVSDHTGIAESVARMQLGSVVACGSEDELALELERYFDRELRLHLTSNIVRFEEYFSVNRYARDVIDVYRTLIEERGG